MRVLPSKAAAAAAALGPIVLVAATSLVSWLVVRGHATSIWMDYEFTGWVAPIANRLIDGVRLHSDHRHSPMPPLPVLLTHALSGGHATWYTESLTIVVAQALLVLVMYVGLARSLPRPIPLVASMLSIPLYFALPKTISHDAIVQVLVALAAVTAVAVASRRGATAEGGRAGAWRRTAGLAFCAFLVALALLAKQSTGAGLAVGVALMLALVGPPPWRDRLARSALFAMLTAAMFLLLCLAIGPWVDIRGMIRDVFLIGSEPKGGSRQVLRNLRIYAVEVFAQAVPFLISGICFAGLAQRARGGPKAAPTSPIGPFPFAFGGGMAWAVSLVAIATPVALLALCWESDSWSTWVRGEAAIHSRTLLWAALLALILASFRGRPFSGAFPEGRPSDGLVALLLVLFPAAVFHSLSVPYFRWFYDNNPLISVALAGLVYALFAMLPGEGPRRPGGLRATAALAGVFVLSGVIWGGLLLRIGSCRECTEEWPEVAHLKGARMRKSADGMRALVARVRRLAPDPKADSVLLPPNDPNVEAWFERPRPELSSSILFADQYWDRYVEGDFEALVRSPPRVIVIGPRDFSPGFQLNWNGGLGCSRLINLVTSKLLPGRYTAQPAQTIIYQGRFDSMDIYVRNGD